MLLLSWKFSCFHRVKLFMRLLYVQFLSHWHLQKSAKLSRCKWTWYKSFLIHF